MKKVKVYYLSKERALQIAQDHNCVSREVAEKYTDSELEEVLRVVSSSSFKLKRGW